MHDGDTNDFQLMDVYAIRERMQLHAGAVGVGGAGREGVVIDALKCACGAGISVERDGTTGAEGGEAIGAQIVHAKDVVGVVMRVEDGVYAGDSVAQGLLAEVWAGVDEDGAGLTFFAYPVNDHRRPQPLVMRVRAGANRTAAPERGNAHGGAAAQEC